jgi:putative intracellular protease/amidase
MKTIVFLYNTSCIYEIVILNYFLKYSGIDAEFVSLDGEPVTVMEGYSINVSDKLTAIDADSVGLMIVPGGNTHEIDNPVVWKYLNQVNNHKGIIAAICAGVDVLDHAGVLNGIVSTHSTDLDVAVDGNIITSRANGYVDFAIEAAKKLRLFKDEQDLQETIAFWRNHQRMQ